LWSDSNQVVKGRYFRVPVDESGGPLKPFLSQPHLFGSQRWWDKNFILDQPALGEVLSRYQKWDNGAPPELRLRASVVGSASCLVQGEQIASGLTVNDIERDGAWPAACVIPTLVDNFGWASTIYRCQVQGWWCQRLIELNNGFEGQAVATMRTRFTGATVTYWLGERFLPSIITVVHPDYLIAVFNTSQDAQQIFEQAIQLQSAPLDVGGFGTIQLWATQAQRAFTRLAMDGGGNVQPCLFVGHSYGGAVSLVASAFIRLAFPERVVRYLAFGAPKPGDIRLQRLLGLPTRGCLLANDDDAVPALPPTGDALLALQAVAPWLGRNFALWETSRETWQQLPDGTIRENTYNMITSQRLFDILQTARTTGRLPDFAAHLLPEYLRRIRLRCPLLPAPAVGGLRLGPARLPGVGLAAGPPDFRSKVGLSSAGELVAGVGLSSAGELVAGVGLSSAGEIVAGVGLASGSELTLGGLGLMAGSPPTPGRTCATAILLVLGVPVPTTALTAQNDWWYIPIVSGTHYTISFTAVSSDDSVSFVYEGTCAMNVELGAVIPYPTNTFGFTAMADDNVLIDVQVNPGALPLSYTIEITSP
jgi:hypothetical protein